jgi:hypothetical protein
MAARPGLLVFLDVSGTQSTRRRTRGRHERASHDHHEVEDNTIIEGPAIAAKLIRAQELGEMPLTCEPDRRTDYERSYPACEVSDCRCILRKPFDPTRGCAETAWLSGKNGRNRARTCDLPRVKRTLSQLSYAPRDAKDTAPLPDPPAWRSG